MIHQDVDHFRDGQKRVLLQAEQVQQTNDMGITRILHRLLQFFEGRQLLGFAVSSVHKVHLLIPDSAHLLGLTAYWWTTVGHGNELLAHVIAYFDASQVIESEIAASAHVVIILKLELPAQAVGVFRKNRRDIEKMVSSRLIEIGVPGLGKLFQLAQSVQVPFGSLQKFCENFRRIHSAQEGSRGNFSFLDDSPHYPRFHERLNRARFIPELSSNRGASSILLKASWQKSAKLRTRPCFSTKSEICIILAIFPSSP